MPEGRLFLGNRRYSSWSLRGWLCVRLAGLDVEEVVLPLGPNGTPAIRAASPNRLVPYLEHRGVRVWESLAIAEYCAEQAPGLWPADAAARAWARSVAAEMHAGFRALRIAMPMNLGREFPGGGQNPDSLADLARIEAIWAEARAAGGGPFLFGGEFGLADAMFAPVVARLLTWKPPVSDATQDYVSVVRAHPLVAQWYADALAEPESWLLDKYENPPGWPPEAAGRAP
ncbi:glutathione S-transferase [Roseomonas sp. NAR14]|uniref:Glutathione S-transferase n=1 Tax=Roseomonas acroporae TaxID=2937791 RepID=A0A9X2BZM2_9PROT|nr:glutathione S-transferase [Roseomonas acroporae]MCK8787200.1 glutathione S-transferase [Roseomonas acroporae]